MFRRVLQTPLLRPPRLNVCCLHTISQFSPIRTNPISHIAAPYRSLLYGSCQVINVPALDMFVRRLVRSVLAPVGGPVRAELTDENAK